MTTSPSQLMLPRHIPGPAAFNVGLRAADHVFRPPMRGASSYGAAAGTPEPLAMWQLRDGLLKPPSGPLRHAGLVERAPLAPPVVKMDLRRRVG